MQKYHETVTDRSGQAIAGATVTVTTAAGAQATIYSDNGVTVASNPLTTDANGRFEFYAADGRYSLSISADNENFSDITLDDILLEDPKTFVDAYALIPTVAVAPTEAPANVPAGCVAVVYCTADEKIYVYNGAWRGTGALS